MAANYAYDEMLEEVSYGLMEKSYEDLTLDERILVIDVVCDAVDEAQELQAL